MHNDTNQAANNNQAAAGFTLIEALTALMALAESRPGFTALNYNSRTDMQRDQRRSKKGRDEAREYIAAALNGVKMHGRENEPARFNAYPVYPIINAGEWVADAVTFSRDADGKAAATYHAGQYYCTEYGHGARRAAVAIMAAYKLQRIQDDEAAEEKAAAEAEADAELYGRGVVASAAGIYSVPVHRMCLTRGEYITYARYDTARAALDKLNSLDANGFEMRDAIEAVTA